MAIISIPTSIGGVTIPGLTNVPGGPLGVLFGNPNQMSVYQYPRDLGSATKGHIVQLQINEIKPINYSESSAVQGLVDAFQQVAQGGSVSEALESAWKGISDSASSIGNILGEAGGKIGEGGTLQEAYQLILDKRKTRKVATVSLYMPETVNFSQEASYGKANLVGSVLDAASKVPLVGGAASLASNVAQSELTQLFLATQGLALNPNEQIMFDGIDFRTYQLAFTFTPYSRAEARSVREIIKLIRLHAAPRIQSGAAGLFFVPPSTFNIKFLLNGTENRFISRVAESVITSIDVNYAPNGWSAHTDGAPTQTTLTINFKEIQLIDRTKIEGGF